MSTDRADAAVAAGDWARHDWPVSPADRGLSAVRLSFIAGAAWGQQRERDKMAGLREALRQSRDAIGNVLEWLDGHAAPNVTEASIERALYEVQDTTARVLDEPF